MFLLKIVFLILIPFSSQASQEFFSKKTLWASNETSAFDPFIDYGEFQDNVTEQESINFFQNGRSLNISLSAGYEAITFNMRQVYGDSPSVIGLSIGFFFDLNFALHIGGLLPHSHYNSLLGTTPNFSTIHVDFKYYFNKQNLIKSAADFFNPYVVFGPFWFFVTNYKLKEAKSKYTPTINTELEGATPQGTNPALNAATQSDDTLLGDHKAAGFKLGLGIEIPFVKQTYIGFEVAYLYAPLDFENQDLSDTVIQTSTNPNKTFFDRLIFPDTPQVEGYRFYGDMVTSLFIFGVNF
ncbi:MAG: hypothetical protein ACR2M7_02395 [Bdellovibrionales bacterium]